MSKVRSKIFVIGCVIVVVLSNRLLQQFPPSPLDCAAITCLAPSGCIDGIGCVEDDDRCDSGQSASGLFCGRGPNRVDCPDATSCNIDPTDRFAICCVDQVDTCGGIENCLRYANDCCGCDCSDEATQGVEGLNGDEGVCLCRAFCPTIGSNSCTECIDGYEPNEDGSACQEATTDTTPEPVDCSLVLCEAPQCTGCSFNGVQATLTDCDDPSQCCCFTFEVNGFDITDRCTDDTPQAVCDCIDDAPVETYCCSGEEISGQCIECSRGRLCFDLDTECTEGPCDTDTVSTCDDIRCVLGLECVEDPVEGATCVEPTCENGVFDSCGSGCGPPICGVDNELPLICPNPIGFGTCVELCSGDDSCPGEQLCCSNGCGHVCMDGVIGPVLCPAVCVPGCQCDEGYILESLGGQCISTKECEGTTTTTEEPRGGKGDKGGKGGKGSKGGKGNKGGKGGKGRNGYSAVASDLMLDPNNKNNIFGGNDNDYNIFGIGMSLFDILLVSGNIMVIMICLVMMVYICCCKDKRKQKYVRTPNKEIDDEEKCDDDNEENKALNDI